MGLLSMPTTFENKFNFTACLCLLRTNSWLHVVSLNLLLALKPRFDVSHLSSPRYTSLFENSSVLNDVWSMIYWVMSSAVAIAEANCAGFCILRVR